MRGCSRGRDSRRCPTAERPLTDLRATLQAALGDAYALERELAGGGMSPVFVATGTALAVLPLVNTGGDPRDECFSDGMTDGLANALPGLVDEGSILNIAMTPCYAPFEFVRDEPAFRRFLAEHQLVTCPLPARPWPPRRAPGAPAP